jgi:hypothetical protein
LLKKERAEVRAALAATTERKSRRRKRIHAGRSLLVNQGQRLTALKEFGTRSDGKGEEAGAC